MRGVSAVIAVILILMITVALAATSYVWFSSVVGTVTTGGTNVTERAVTGFLADFRVESTTAGTIYVRNTGDTQLTGWAVYINDMPITVTATPTQLSAGQVGTITLPHYAAKPGTLKITTAEGATKSTEWSHTFWDPQAAAIWQFDEGSGGTAADSSGKGNTCTLKNGATWGTGKLGGGLVLDGVNDYADCGAASSLNPTTALTIMVWVKPGRSRTAEASGWFEGFVQKGQNFVFGWEGWDDGIGYGVTYSADNNWYSSGFTQPLSAGQWYHFAYTFNGAQLQSYANGALKLTTPKTSGTIRSTTDPLKIGAVDFVPAYLSGTIDEVIVLNRTMSATEVAADYAAWAS